jgi:hypothetical protein
MQNVPRSGCSRGGTPPTCASFEDRLAYAARRFKEQAKSVAPGKRRAALLRKAGHFRNETAVDEAGAEFRDLRAARDRVRDLPDQSNG